MASRLNPYVAFKDNAREAMTFYQSVFGGNLEMHTFSEFGASQDPSEDGKIMHSMLAADNGLTFMAADTPNGMNFDPGGQISMSLSGDDDAELRGYWDKLSADGQITMPLEKQPWGDVFGMCTDRFGLYWMVNIASPGAGA